jgi:heterotetrameric sarcosine oxidase delta subunit
MRIPCPFCGERDSLEFVCRGEAAPERPAGEEGLYDYVYTRDNAAGPMREHWYHADGCRNWLIVTRDTRTHEVFEARLAKGAAR